ncbi:MAG: copper resistance system multicopper oxidase [Micropepsaceae bacterium]
MPPDLSKPGKIISPTRRRFVQGLAASSAASLLWRSPSNAQGASPSVLQGNHFDLDIAPMPFNLTGRPRIATVVNGMLPSPTLRWHEGDTVTINVTNHLSEDTSIHWHGIMLPASMDGVPGLTFPGIKPGETFTYQFPVKQGGTYWYHSHSGMQEQTGMYGALVIASRWGEAHEFDREHVIVLSDWTDEDPMTVVANLKMESHFYNRQERTLGTFFDDARRMGFGAALNDRLMWGDMRMSPTDIMDVTGSTYTFLVNGRPPAANWTALFEPGERVRLRVINASAMTTFDMRIPGLDLMVVQADGVDIQPVTVEEFRIGVAETYDVIVTPEADTAYTIFAQAQDRSGYARATLAPREGMRAPVPAMDPRPLRTMADMGMDHANMAMGEAQTMPGMDHGNMDHGAMQMGEAPAMPGMDHANMDHANMTMGDTPAMPEMDHANMPMGEAPAMPEMDHANMDHANMDHGAMAGASAIVENADGVDVTTLRGHPTVANIAEMPQSRLAQAGTGLDGNGRRVLTYADLRSLSPHDDMTPPSRTLEFHLTGNMDRFVWGFNGKKFSESAPIHVALGEKIRFTLINNTMMEHPIHLHGFFTVLENGQGNFLPLKHTINVKPGERLSTFFLAHTPGHWAFHCHLIYHMEAGMFRTILVS